MIIEPLVKGIAKNLNHSDDFNHRKTEKTEEKKPEKKDKKIKSDH
jgi:hypothetical protein